eukprot:CAMPEP_0183715372 /NCGR_PEP_ID=MMETSP0737-20130205/9619_1 /TAXON_ID=385413 /ORGANISM="Thalassiosira miniscula, Strain CCMP1093" /LENGTH=1519 /DNA_ID=CAMNT_0025944463 /DNA_START=22 /DNA_END=4581 /DNA_ORIENTATION=-
MADDPDAAQEGTEVGISFDGEVRQTSVTFADQNEPIIIDTEDEEDADAGDDGAPGPGAPPQEEPADIGARQSSSSAASGASYISFRKSASLPFPARKASFVDRNAKWPRRLSERSRGDYLAHLVQQRRESMRMMMSSVGAEEMEGGGGGGDSLDDVTKSVMENHSEFVRGLKGFVDNLGEASQHDATKLPEMEVRLQNVSYQVPSLDVGSQEEKVPTIYNSSPLYLFERLFRTATEEHTEKKQMVTNVLTNVNLVLKPKCMYLVLGPPLSGKTSLLKAIAGMLPQGNFPAGYPEDKHLTGKVLYNNLVCSGDGADESNRTLLQNLVAFVRQQDAHAPRLTVAETFLFSGNCKDENIRKNDKGTDKNGKVGLTLEGLGLSHVQDTFVGNEQIRGVSGGQRRRVTLGEMLVFDTPLLCGDEISTGLDTASTVDILRILSYVSRIFGRISVVSLLQPSPEAVALFDEVILLSEGGNVIYAGPTEDACDHFRLMGYAQPDSMDNADYLLAVAGPDRKHLYRPLSEEEGDDEPHSLQEIRESFHTSRRSLDIAKRQSQEWEQDWSTRPDDDQDMDSFRKKYQHSFGVSVWLNLKRSFTLWTRDKIFIRASIIKNIAMGISVGAVFFDTDFASSFFGVLFQGNLFIMLGAMASAPDKVDDRTIFYKHADSNFYPALSYILGQALALIPQMLIDVLLFGTFVYWMVGFTATASGFILYLALFFSFNFTMGQLFGLLAAVAPSKTVVQAGGAVILLLNTLFCGYIVSPVVIPPYYIWIYWMVPLSWVYRALLLNEFTSDAWTDDEGDKILRSFGFLYKGEPFTREWIGYGFAYLAFFLVVCVLISAACLQYLRMEPKPKGISQTPDKTESEEKDAETESNAGSTLKHAEFIPVDLSFKDIIYEVKASKGSETLRLLNNISGVFSAGRMCALMGESGAGKTTLMDVIALRKGGGDIQGEVLLNGFPQESDSFRRCSGYVEQFDVQSAELTVRETIRFSAQLRLQKSDPVYNTPNGLEQHINFIIDVLELTREADSLVGNEEEGGLTFEQKKRLSIAVEVAASPSIIFLDEPTSGLDARAALLVMNAMKKLCDSGRTVVATIHQPSSAVFDMFDDLMLLKKGGEVVFFGDLGVCSANLVAYFEELGATRMNKGENPATWMLNVLGQKIMSKGNDTDGEPLNFAEAWKDSSNYVDLQRRLSEAAESKDENLEIKFDTQFAVPWYTRDNLMAKRLSTIYWRSPAYNLARMALSLVIALLLGSIFIPIRSKDVFSEPEIYSLLGTIFISFIIIGVLSVTSVLPVMLSVRDMYYRHKAAGMLNSRSVGRALSSAEKKFIIISCFLFCLVFIPLSGITNSPSLTLRERVMESIAFWGFFTFNMAIYSYCGQLFMCLVRGQGTAYVLCSVFIGINNFFSGFIVRPQQMMGGFWEITYWICPGHYVYEGLVMTVFHKDERKVSVSEGSDYYFDLNCDEYLVDGVCEVPVYEYVDTFFGKLYNRDNVIRNLLILGGILFLVRFSTFMALRFLTYSGK